MAGTQVILYRSSDTGAPTLNGVAGSLLAVLDACLVDGYNNKSVQSITRTGTTATATFATAHGFNADGLTRVSISGASQSEYNGEFKIFNVTGNSFDFTVSGSPATPATGTITAKVPPLGWGKPFANASNIGCYRSSEVTGTRLFLRVVDDGSAANGALDARLRGYENLTDLNTGTGLFPTDAQVSGGLFLTKSNTLDSTARSWVLVGDGFEFALFHAHGFNSLTPMQWFHFGDPVTEMSSDPYGTLIIGSTASQYNANPETNTACHTFSAATLSTTQAGHYFSRAFTQIGGSVSAGKFSPGYSLANSTTFGLGNMPYPAGHNNGLYIAPVLVGEATANIVRATLKCIYNPVHTRPLGQGTTYTNPAGLSGRTLYAIATPNSAGTPGETHIDITGPWR